MASYCAEGLPARNLGEYGVNTPYGEILGMRISSALGQSPTEPQPGSCESRDHGVLKKETLPT